jgi:hypothetical protein
MPQTLPEEDFEDEYTGKFGGATSRPGTSARLLARPRGYDLGLHLSRVDSRELPNIKVWFQLKGKHETTLNLDQFWAAEEVAIAGIPLDQVRFGTRVPKRSVYRAHPPRRCPGHPTARH